MKKKCYIAFLILTLTVSAVLTGCTGEKKEAVSEELVNEDGETEDDDLEPEEEETKETDAGQEEKEADKGKEKEEVVPIRATRGEVRDDMFVNETFGISFPLTKDMDRLDDLEVLEVLGADTDSMEEGEVVSAKEMEDALEGVLYDAVFFLDKGTSSNITVSYENMDVTMDGDYLDERHFAGLLKDDLEQQSPGMYKIKSQKTVVIGDVQYLRVDLEMKESELKEIFCCRRVENYMVCVTITFIEEKRQAAEDFIDSLGGSTEREKEDSSLSIQGTVEDGFYINETFGIRFPITDNMSIMSEREMEAAQGIGSEYLEDEGLISSEQMDEISGGVRYDLTVYLDDRLSNIIVSYEDLDITTSGSIKPDAETYGKALRFTFARLEDFGYEFCEDSTVTLGGKEYYRMDFDVDAMGVACHQIYVMRREENYMISFVITYRDGMEQQVEDFLDSITDV